MTMIDLPDELLKELRPSELQLFESFLTDSDAARKPLQRLAMTFQGRSLFSVGFSQLLRNRDFLSLETARPIARSVLPPPAAPP
jgi:hypothetical protein